MQRVITNNFRIKPAGTESKLNGQNGVPKNTSYSNLKKYKFNEKKFNAELKYNLKTRWLAFAIFLLHFIECGALGLVPEKFLFVYRNVRLSDLILYFLIGYSIVCYNEYKYLLKSKSFRLVLIFLIYIITEFFISFIRYKFNLIEYFFRLKGLWTSFLIFPYMLLLVRNGFPFLIKIIFPVSLISNFLYILSALTGIPFLPSINIISAVLPGDIQVFRVFGGTFYGELFFLGFIYFWITRKFKFWQVFPAVLFIIPHILAFGRGAWAYFVFTILTMILVNTLRKRNFKILFKQAAIMIAFGLTLIFCFIQFIPESEFYIDALKARLLQGQNDIKYSEGTYGTRVITQNDALIKLWKKNDVILGIGMHPMWVVKPETMEEIICYGAFCDVYWPSVLAAYGLLGFIIAFLIQFYYIKTAYKILKVISQTSLSSLFICILLSKLVFDTAICFSYIFISVGLWGFSSVNYLIPFIVYSYEYLKKQNHNSTELSII